MATFPSLPIRTVFTFTGNTGQGWITIGGGIPLSHLGDFLVGVFDITASPPVQVTVGFTDTIISGPSGAVLFGGAPYATGFTTPGGGVPPLLDAVWQESTSNLSGNTYLGIIGVGNPALS